MKTYLLATAIVLTLAVLASLADAFTTLSSEQYLLYVVVGVASFHMADNLLGGADA